MSDTGTQRPTGTQGHSGTYDRGSVGWRALVGLTLLVGLAFPAHATAESLPTVAIDAREVSAADYRALDLLGLQRKLALRLSQAGFAVVDPARGPQIRLAIKLGGQPARVAIVATSSAGSASRQVARSKPGDDLESLHLELIHKSVEAAREVAPAPDRKQPQPPATAPASPAHKPAPPPQHPKPDRPAPPSTERRWAFEAGGGAGLQLAQGGADIWLGLAGRLGLDQGPGLRIAAEITPPLDDRPTVVEVTLRAGPSWRLPLAPTHRIDIELAVLAGVALHTFRLDGAVPDAGTRADFVISGELHLAWQVSSRWRLALRGGGVLREGAREHRLDGQRIWRRSALRAQGGLVTYFSY